MGNQNIKPMVEGGILAAITVAMALISMYVPLLGAAAALVWPLPIAVLVVRHGVRWGIMAAAVSSFLIAMLIHPLQALAMAIAVGSVGLALGLVYRRGYNATMSIGICVLVSVAAKGLMLVAASVVMGVNPLDFQVDAMRQALDMSVDIYRAGGMSETDIQSNMDNFNYLLEMVRLLFPVAIVFAGIIDAFVNFVIVGKVLRKLGHVNLPSVLPFSRWRFTWHVAALYVVSILGMSFGASQKIDVLYQIALNTSMLATFIGIIEGFSVLLCAFRKYQITGIVRMILMALLLTNGLLTHIVALIGLFDTIFDYRKRFALLDGNS